MSKSNKIVALRCGLLVGLIAWGILSWMTGAIIMGLVPAVLSCFYQVGHIWVDLSHRKDENGSTQDTLATD